jgi:hypothetical protein
LGWGTCNRIADIAESKQHQSFSISFRLVVDFVIVTSSAWLLHDDSEQFGDFEA